MTSPQGMWGGPSREYLESRLKQMQDQIDALQQRGVKNAGALTLRTPQGNLTFQVGPIVSIPLPDGTPQWVTVIRDSSGAARWALYDPDTVSGGFVQTLWEWDHLGNILRTSDILGGWAEPWFAVVLYPYFSMGASSTYLYMNTACNVAEQTLWSGHIGYVTHSNILVRGVWGAAGGTNNTRYRLKINGVTVGTWDVSASAVISDQGPFNILGATSLMNRSPRVDLTAQTLSGSGSYACQVSHCHQRQS